MREIPARADTIARQTFESYTGEQRKRSIQGFIGTATMTYQAVTKAGPLAALVTVPLGIIGTWWQKKSYREQAYAQFEVIGLVRKPGRRIRTAATGGTGWRYPGGAVVADVIVAVLHEARPELTQTQLNTIALNALKTLRQFRTVHNDAPIEIAADVILASHGIFRGEAGTDTEYTYSPGDTIDISDLLQKKPGAFQPPAPKTDTQWGYYAIGALGIIFILRKLNII